MAPNTPSPVAFDDWAHEVQEDQLWFWVVGILSAAIGGLAILVPHVTTLATGVAIGAILVVSGMFEGIAAFRSKHRHRLIARALMAAVGVVAGCLLLVNPLEGVIALTFLLIAFFLVTGGLRLYYAWQLRGFAGWGWLTLSGVLAIALGVLIWSGLPGTAFWILGLLVGIDLMFYGAALISVVLVARRRLRAAEKTKER